MAMYSRLTGDAFEFPDQKERELARLARMRHIVWLGVKTMGSVQDVDGGALTMYTLTYTGIDDWAPRHISGCLRWLRAQGVRAYVWVGELQRRGAVHYHVLCLLPEGQRWVKPSAAAGGWARGFTWVTPNIERPLYIMKYLQKEVSKHGRTKFPRGFRLYGIAQWLVRRMPFEYAVPYRGAQLPRWFREGAEDDCIIRASFRVAGGVAYGRQVAVSPYATSDLPLVVQLNGWLYNDVDTLAHPVQG